MFTGCNQNGLHLRTSLSADELEARHYDIPILLNAIPQANKCEQKQNDTILTYTLSGDFSSAISFYQEEMERHGWRQLYNVEGHEALLGFEKPQKFATISIRPIKNQLTIIIVISAKDSFIR
jgi:hypothetical protein